MFPEPTPGRGAAAPRGLSGDRELGVCLLTVATSLALGRVFDGNGL